MNDTAAVVAADAPIARVRGEPLTAFPQDLFIPPDALEVFLEAFEGPLDLLLYLIKKQNLDILDIPIARITTQYMEYLGLMEAHRFELAAEYLVMAAWLAEIKSRLLLPKPPLEDDDEVDDPRAELVRRLLEYERFKRAAEDLDALPRLERDVFTAQAAVPPLEVNKPDPEVRLEDLVMAFRAVLERAELSAHHVVNRERLSVRECMSRLLERLDAVRFTAFDDLFDPAEGRLGVVVTFLAVLELVKAALLELVQNGAYAPLHVRLKGASR